MEPGVYPELSNREYHNAPGISKSGLDLIAKCPSLYKHRYIDGNHPDPTPAMLVGSLVHKLALEPDLFDQEFAVAPEISRRTKAGKIEWEAFVEANKGKKIVSHDDFRKAREMAEAVLIHPVAGGILKDGMAEISMFHRLGEGAGEEGTLVKVRPDWIVEDVIADIKTTTDASATAFSRSCYNFGYHMQAALYMDVSRIMLRRQINDFLFIAVENKEPYQVAIYRADKDMVEFGRAEYMRHLATYKMCLQLDKWPSYNDESITTISLPRWALAA